jgi:thymidylate synthase (FAD)
VSVRVHLLARPAFDVGAVVAFLAAEGLVWRRSGDATPAEEIIEVAGRVCYMSFGERQSPRNNIQYIENLIKSGHESVLEHVSWTFLIQGVSRAFTHQLVRHRPGWAFSQLSQQYCDQAGAIFVEPEELKEEPEALKEWRSAVESARAAYVRLSDLLSQSAAKRGKEKVRAMRSAARSVLPNATESKIVVTANARALRHFLIVRGSIEGDSEMRRVSSELLKVVAVEAPHLFADFSLESLPDGSPIVIHQALAHKF